jgi:hypothetical protein
MGCLVVTAMLNDSVGCIYPTNFCLTVWKTPFHALANIGGPSPSSSMVLISLAHSLRHRRYHTEPPRYHQVSTSESSSRSSHNQTWLKIRTKSLCMYMYMLTQPPNTIEQLPIIDSQFSRCNKN